MGLWVDRLMGLELSKAQMMIYLICRFYQLEGQRGPEFRGLKGRYVRK